MGIRPMPFAVRSRLGAAAILAALGLAGLAAPAPAADAVWPVEGKLLGAPGKMAGDAKKAKDVSGIACATASGFPRVCVVADDSSQGAQIVVLHEGRLVAGDAIRLTDASYGGDLLELDAEAVAYADGAFYVLGSHGRPRHRDGGTGDAETTAKSAARRQLFRVTFDIASVDPGGRLAKPATVTRSLALSEAIKAEPSLAPFFDGALGGGGIDFEGAAIQGGRLYAGLRGPVLDGKAAILSVPLGRLFEGAAGRGELHLIDLGHGRGIRDLVAYENGLLVLGGPVRDPSDDAVADGDYVVAWWDGAAPSRPLGPIPPFGPKVKPEALVPLDRADGRLRLLVLFDGPPEGAPRMVTVEAP